MGWLRVFDAIGRLGSLTRAAEELGLSQPAISYQIRRLEQQVGAQLLRRLHRGVRLTDAGEVLHRAVTAGVGRVDEAIREIRLRDRAPAVRIFTDYGFAALWLMPRVADFRRANPGTEVHVVASQDLTGAASDIADISVLFGDRSDVPDGARLLMPERVVPVCAPGLAERLPKGGAVEALAGMPLLHLDTVGKPRWFTWTTWLRTHGVEREPAVGDLGLNSYGFVVQAAVAEQGLALGWIGLVDANLANGSLVAVGPEVRRDGVGYWLTVSPQAHPASHALRDWLFSAMAAA